ncbi:hypothetical protein [Nocardioides bruguierae]|uniref:Uncharacterized protein n=1 Tax=Nocardioides bruguierae TaxID=2945102 RepID=A0A9X2DBD6_9ACTN|nr:hypothetical protein [Nocardioides bruguierae]MCM0622812.1 hypothetical protein [Nocardioides bruguierae]
MNDLAAVRAEILSAATEDLTGVYEAWWTANTMRPDLALSARLALAEESLWSLLSDGLVALSRGSWESQIPVPEHEVEQVLREYKTWDVDDAADRIFFEATAAGHAAYGLPG